MSSSSSCVFSEEWDLSWIGGRLRDHVGRRGNCFCSESRRTDFTIGSQRHESVRKKRRLCVVLGMMNEEALRCHGLHHVNSATCLPC